MTAGDPLSTPRPARCARPSSQLDHDPARISDVEIVALVLGGRGGAAGVAERVLERNGISGLRDRALVDLAREPGVGRWRAARLLASVELGRRVFGVATDGPAFDSPETVAFETRDLAGQEREHFAVILLNARHRYLGRELISIGSLNASIVHPREVFRPAIQAASAAVILAHNHPSGDPSPSRDDVEITRRLARAGEIIGIPVLDHVIVARRSFVSLRREGLMPD